LVAALERWIFVSGSSPGEPLFRSIKKVAKSVGGSATAV
jgi:hypothetical protein